MRLLFLFLVVSVNSFGQGTALEFLMPRVNNASEVHVTAHTTTSVTFNWTDGNQSDRIAVVRAGSAVNSDPVNTTTYTANAAFGSGTQIGSGNYVVHIGSGPVTVTSLTAGTIYYIAVYEFNGGAGNESYLTTNPGEGYGIAITSEYQAVLTYASGQGFSAPSISQQQVAAIYVDGLVDAGLWAKKRVIWIPANNGGKDFGRINYKDPGNFTLTESGTVNFTTNEGFSSNGTSYMDTGFKLVTNAGGLYAAGSAHYTCGVGGAILGNDNYVEFGVTNASSNAGVWYGAATANFNAVLRLNSNSSVNRTYDGISYGYMIMTRRTASSNTIFRQKNFVKDNLANTSVTPSDNNVYICAANINGTPSFHSQRPVRTVQLGTELTDGDLFTDRTLWGDYIEGIQGTRLEVNHGPFTTYETTLNIIATRDNYQFASDGYNLRFSDDYGETWTIYPWGPDYNVTTLNSYLYTVTFAHIFESGTVLFTISNKIYTSTDGLATAPVETTPQHADGSPYTLHSPSNATRPGNYFGCYDVEPVPSTITGGDEILVWGSYNNVFLGAAPVNVWYTIDEGATVKAAYEFGQNSQFRDDGTEDGGTTGTLLGDAGNSTVARHVHHMARKPGTLDWYLCTGDGANGLAENNWIKLSYDEGLDEWTPTIVYSTTAVNIWKSVSINFDGNDLYFGADGGSDLGLYVTTVGDIGVTATETLDSDDLLAGVRINPATGFIVTIPVATYITIAQNFGATFFNFEITGADVTNARMLGIGNKDARGYYKFNVGGGAFNHSIKTVFVKENE